MKERLFWPDAVKGICMLIIYFSHTRGYYALSWVDGYHFIDPFFVNAFFFVTGYFFLYRQWTSPIVDESRRDYFRDSGRRQVLNVLFRLVIPAILFSLLTFLPKLLLKSHGGVGEYFVYKSLLGGTYWFISALVSAYLVLLIPLFLRIRKVGFYIGYSVVCAIVGGYLNDYTLPWHFDKGLLVVGFIVAGGLFHYVSNRFFRLRWGWMVVPTLLYVLVTLFFYTDLDIHCTGSAGDYNMIGYVVSLLGSLLLVWICYRLPYCRLLSFIGSHSLLFYFFSGAVPYMVVRFVGVLFPRTELWFWVFYVVSVAVAWGVVWMIDRWLPWMVDLRKLRAA